MAAMAQKSESQVEKNYEAFQKLLPELLKTHAGKFAVLHDEKLIEIFDSLADAVRFGATKYGAGNFSVQEIASKDVNLGFYSYALHHASN